MKIQYRTRDIEGDSPAGGPAVTVTLNPLCHNVTYTVELSFGVREEEEEEEEEEECLPQQTVSATLLPGAAISLPTQENQHCFSRLSLSRHTNSKPPHAKALAALSCYVF